MSYLPLFQSPADRDRDFAAIAETGATSIRLDFIWSVVQRGGRDSWDWSAIDSAVQAAQAYGLEVLANPAYTPVWASGQADDKYPPTNPADFARFVTAAVQRYPAIEAWELWNEPNVPSFWRPAPDAAAFVRLLAAGYAAVNAVDPGDTVISGGLAHSGPSLDSQGDYGISPYRFARMMYDAGARGSFDAFGLHPYPAFPLPPDSDAGWNTLQQTDEIHALMTARGDGAKDIWATEAGYHTAQHPEGVTEQQQATYLVQMIDQWEAWDFTGPLFLYMPRDRSGARGDPEENYGVLMRHDFTRKPAFAALVARL